jgi:hypothetical protein
MSSMASQPASMKDKEYHCHPKKKDGIIVVDAKST